MEKSDELAVNLLKNREIKGIGILYDRYAPCLYGLALKLTNSETVSMQLVERIFVRVWEERLQFLQQDTSILLRLLKIGKLEGIIGEGLRDMGAPMPEEIHQENPDLLVHFHYSLLQARSMEELESTFKLPTNAIRKGIKLVFQNIKNRFPAEAHFLSGFQNP